MDAETIHHFWFKEITPDQWYKKDPQFDQALAARFLAVHDAARKGECYLWRKTPRGRLAEIIVLDQFSRNIYRDRPQAFAQDAMALALAQELVGQGLDHQFDDNEKSFAYMPYTHSESAVMHEIAYRLFNDAHLTENLKFEILHKKIIDRFGRYPHRNHILGRTSTAEEKQFLTEPNSSF